MTNRTILYVEDEENDVLLLQLGFHHAGLKHPLQVVYDGQEAIAYLSGTGRYAARDQYPLPDLVLLDLNLPRLSGMQVLQWLREQPQFSSLPVVIYTSSDHPRDQENARRLGATDYVLKPSRLEHIAQLARRLDATWLTPTRDPAAPPPAALPIIGQSPEPSAAAPR